MTLAQTTRTQTVTRNGTATDYVVTYSVGADADLEVFQETGIGTNVYTLQTSPTDYSLSGSPTGGPYAEGALTVQFANGGVSGRRALFLRTSSLQQTQAFPTATAFDPNTIEKRFDASYRLFHEFNDDLTRSLKVPNAFSGTFTTEFTPVASNLLLINSSNNGITPVGLGAGVTIFNGNLTYSGPAGTFAPDGAYGDITVSASGQTWSLNAGVVDTAEIVDDAVTTAKIVDDAVATAKIADDAVSYAKLQNVTTTDRLLGRATAGAGIVEEISLGAELEMLSGALRVNNTKPFDEWVYSSATNNVDLDLPSSGQVLILLDGVQVATDDRTLFMRLSNDGGSTFISSGTHHSYNHLAVVPGSNANYGLDNQNEFVVFYGPNAGEGLGSATNENGTAAIWLSKSANTLTTFYGVSSHQPATGTIFNALMAGRLVNTLDHDAVRFFFESSANFAGGRIRVYDLG